LRASNAIGLERSESQRLETLAGNNPFIGHDPIFPDLENDMSLSSKDLIVKSAYELFHDNLERMLTI